MDDEPIADETTVTSGRETADGSNKSRNDSVVVARVPKRVYKEKEQQYFSVFAQKQIDEHLLSTPEHDMQQKSTVNSSLEIQRSSKEVDRLKERRTAVRSSECVNKERSEQCSSFAQKDKVQQEQHLISTPKQMQPKSATNSQSTHQTSHLPPITSRRSPIPYEFTGELPSLSESYSFHESHKNYNNEVEASSERISSYSKPPIPDDSDEVTAGETASKSKSKRKKKKKHKVVFENTPANFLLPNKLSNLSLSDDISDLFTTKSSEQNIKSNRLRRRSRGDSTSNSQLTTEEEERLRRFEEAYAAILAAVEDPHNDEATIVSSEWMNSGGKRWRRNPNVSAAISVDGRSYDDLQRGPTVGRRSLGSDGKMEVFAGGNLRCTEPLFDRGASWMVHVPRVKGIECLDEKEESSPSRGRGRQRGIHNRNVLLSPCQKKLSDIERSVQRSVSRPKFDLVQNRKAVVQTPFEGDRGERRFEEMKRNGLNVGVTSSAEKLSPGPQREVIAEDIDNHGDKSIKPHRQENAQSRDNSAATPNANSHEANGHDNNIRNPPSTVRTSSLRLLFSGIVDAPPPVQSKTNSFNALTSPQDRSKVSGMRELFEHPQDQLVHSKSPCPDPIATVFGSKSGYSMQNKSMTVSNPSGSSAGKFGPKASSSFYARVNNTFAAAPPERETAGASVGKFSKSSPPPAFYDRVRDAFAEENSTNVHRTDSQRKSNVQSPDPPYGIDRNESNSSSMSATLQTLDVANLVRQSLSQRLDRSVIDTDGTATDITGGYDEAQYMDKMGSLLMSPALLTKRYLQALEAIELRNWEQISFLINADPWLMEMKDLRNDQYLIHVLALFGAGQHDGDDLTAQPPAPKDLIQTMLEHDPSVAHKLDYEGNLPLHMAAASGNIDMIHELGLRFPGAASVQNHDGFLPLHLAIMSCALFRTGEQAVSLILALFHGGVCVKDNEGNTPLHTVARTLKGDVGVDIIYQLKAVCNKLAHDKPVHLRECMGGNVKKPKRFDDTATMITTTTDPFTDTSGLEDPSAGSLFCLAKSNTGDTPLARAIKSLAGWQVIEALLSMNGGHLAVLEKNSAAQNALHLALEVDFNDASVVLAILKAAPSAAPIADGSGFLPIQLACMNCLQREIILAISIIDLPIDLGTRQEAILRNGFGSSWWFLVCESDDRYVDIVSEILSMCSHPQKTALCLIKGSHIGTNKSAISCATPQCKMALMRSLRFLGRFEFTGDDQINDPSFKSSTQFRAIDFGTLEKPFHAGRKVMIRCYLNDVEYIKENRHFDNISLPEQLFEDLEHFSLTENEPNAPQNIPVKHCVSMTIPSMSLARVIAGMPKDHRYRRDAKSLTRYFGKVTHILQQTAKALSHLHENKIVHCHVDSHHIGKFNDVWKLTGLVGSFANGSKISTHHLGLNFPPEAFSSNVALRALPLIDVWSFGKLMYEVFVGESLFAPFQEEGDDHIVLLSWNERHQAIIADQLYRARIGQTGIDLITRCLCKRIEMRFSSMMEVAQHQFWLDANAFEIH